MKMNLRFPNPVKTTGKELFAMTLTHKLTNDIDAQRRGMVDYLDTLNYMNGNSFDSPIETRHCIAYMAMALPSLAYIDSHKTREMIYNLNLVCANIISSHLKLRISPYNSDNILLIEECFSEALYRLISGRNMYDDAFHKSSEAIFDLIQKNQITQHISGIDTTRGRFEVLPNAMALIALEIHDKIFGTRFSSVKNCVLTFIREKIQDPETQLYYESYMTGSIGYANESINPMSAWRTNVLRPSVNGLALTFMHYFDPTSTEKAWTNYKALFMESILDLKAEDIADSVGCSFNTQLGPGSEDIMAALLLAKEMNDVDAFEKIHTHILETGEPHLWEGHLCFTKYGDLEHLIGHFMFFAKAHVGWNNLLNHPWQNFYHADYIEIR